MPAKAQQDWMQTICSFWMNGKFLFEQKCLVAWGGANKVMAITAMSGEPGHQHRRTVRPYEDGWRHGRYSECLVYPPTGYAICQKTAGHRFDKDYLSN